MNEGLIRIQKGYLLIEKARSKIKMLSESKDILDDRRKLQEMKEMESRINEDTNALKNKINENEEELQKKEKELNKLIKHLYTNQKNESKVVKEHKKREKEIEQERVVIRKEIMELFMKVDALKEQMNNYKIMYNETEKKFLRKLSFQNTKIVKYEDKITLMEKKIRKIRKSIDSEVLSLYDKKRQKSIVVMSEILSDKCKECGQELEQEILERVGRQEIIECPNCGKILYIAVQEDKEEEKNV